MYYWVYGFPLRSEVHLPELREISRENANESSPRIATIEYGPVPAEIPGEQRFAPFMSYVSGCWLFTIPDVGRILVERGNRIVIERAPNCLDSDLRTYVLGTALATLAHQRGLIALHVGALLGPAGAVAITGPSGAGKSTAVATLSEALGWVPISDDVAVLSVEGDKVTLEGGVCRMRLWGDALKRLGVPTTGLTRDIHRFEKFLLEDKERFSPGPHSFQSIYEIVPDYAGPTRLLQGAEAFSVLMNAIYRPFVAGIEHNRQELLQKIATAAQVIDTRKGGRPDATTFHHDSIARKQRD